MSAGVTWSARGPAAGFLEGLAVRSLMTDCPLWGYTVRVTKCTGGGECKSVCAVGVFGRDGEGRCVVRNEELCFGCMACVAQCADGGVSVEPREARNYPTADDLLR